MKSLPKITKVIHSDKPHWHGIPTYIIAECIDADGNIRTIQYRIQKPIN